MIINQSILPFYTNRAYQHNNFRWYAQGLYSPLVAPAGYLPTFQIVRTTNLGAALTFTLRNCATGTETDITADVSGSGLTIDQTYSYDVILYAATLPISVTTLANYEIIVTDGSNTWYSEKWAMSDRTNEMVKLTYWHLEDFEFDQDADEVSYFIKYTAPFKNVAYIDTELFKPKYPYYREVEQRLGRNFDKLHISAKEYVFDFQASEEIIDAMRLIPLHDKKTVEYKGRSYVVDELLIEPNWQDHGDLANMLVTFRTNTIALVGGRSTNQVYEPTAGSCLTLEHYCIGIVENGSAEYLAFQYTDGDGVTQDLQDSDKVVVFSGSNIRVFQYAASVYTLQTTPAQTAVFVLSSGLYYVGVGSNIITLPQIQFYDYGSGQIAGSFLPGGTHQIYYVIGGIETLIGNYTYTELAIDGVFVTLIDNVEFLRMRIASAACGIFQQTTDYELQEAPGGDAGIGSDVIGSTLIVY